MTKKLFLLLILSCPAFLLAQSELSHCDKVFTKSEQIPSLKISNEAFEDTLAAVLKSNKFPLKKSEISYRFILTSTSQIDDLILESGTVKKEKVLRETILNFAALWNPAVQNGRSVCSYVHLKIVFVTDKMIIDIRQ